MSDELYGLPQGKRRLTEFYPPPQQQQQQFPLISSSTAVANGTGDPFSFTPQSQIPFTPVFTCLTEGMRKINVEAFFDRYLQSDGLYQEPNLTEFLDVILPGDFVDRSCLFGRKDVTSKFLAVSSLVNDVRNLRQTKKSGEKHPSLEPTFPPFLNKRFVPTKLSSVPLDLLTFACPFSLSRLAFTKVMAFEMMISPSSASKMAKQFLVSVLPKLWSPDQLVKLTSTKSNISSRHTPVDPTTAASFAYGLAGIFDVDLTPHDFTILRDSFRKQMSLYFENERNKAAQKEKNKLIKAIKSTSSEKPASPDGI